MCILFSLFRAVVTVTHILFNAASTAEVLCVTMYSRMIVVLRMMVGRSFCAIVMVLFIPESKQKWRNVESTLRAGLGTVQLCYHQLWAHL
jgi:hypothetical protein